MNRKQIIFALLALAVLVCALGQVSAGENTTGIADADEGVLTDGEDEWDDGSGDGGYEDDEGFGDDGYLDDGGYGDDEGSGDDGYLDDESYGDDDYYGDDEYYEDEDLDDDYEPREITMKPLTVKYSANKIYYKVALTSDGYAVSGEELELDMKVNGEWSKWYFATTNRKGIATFVIPALKPGVYPIEVISESGEDWADSYIKVVGPKPVKTAVKAPAITVNKNEKKFFTVTVKTLKGKAIANLKLKVSIFTGNAYKTYVVKTNKKGVAALSTKNLKAGTHKVVVASGDARYSVAKSSKIVVKNNAKSKVITINLPKLSKTYTVKYGKFIIQAMKWKAFSYQEVDVMVYVKNTNNMYNKYKYLSKVSFVRGGKADATPWKHGSVDCVYHKYQFMKSTIIKKVQIKL